MCKQLLAIALIVSATGCTRLTTVGPLELEGNETIGISSTQQRDAMQSRLLRQSHEKCNALLSRIQERPTRESRAMKIITVILAAWATASPEKLTAGLTAGAAGFTALDQGLGEDWPDDTRNVIQGIRLAQAFIDRDIDAGRAVGLDQYNADDAVTDVERFHGVCTIEEGRATASQAAAVGAAQMMTR